MLRPGGHKRPLIKQKLHHLTDAWRLPLEQEAGGNWQRDHHPKRATSQPEEFVPHCKWPCWGEAHSHRGQSKVPAGRYIPNRWGRGREAGGFHSPLPPRVLAFWGAMGWEITATWDTPRWEVTWLGLEKTLQSTGVLPRKPACSSPVPHGCLSRALQGCPSQAALLALTLPELQGPGAIQG